MPVLWHDDRQVVVSAQDNNGVVWAIGGRPREALLRWKDGQWFEVSDASDWDGSRERRFSEDIRNQRPMGILGADQAGALAMWPSAEGGVESLWESKDPLPEQLENKTPGMHLIRYFGYRHTIDQARLRLGQGMRVGIVGVARHSTEYRYNFSWRNAPVNAVLAGADSPWLLASEHESVGTVGLYTLNEPGPVVSVGVMRSFGSTDIQSRALRQPRAAMDGKGTIWLWGERSPRFENRRPKDKRYFACFRDGEFDLSPEIKGLSTEEDVTEFVMLPDGRGAVLAVRGEGLWTVDLDERTAVRRDSPPLPTGAPIWSWQAWPDDMEVVLAADETHLGESNHRGFWAVLWLRKDGTWSERGRFRVDTWQGHSVRPLPECPLHWTRWDNHLILTGPRNAWVLSLADDSTKAVALNWRFGVGISRPKAAYALSSDQELLLIGEDAAVLLKPGQVAERLSAGSAPIIRMEECLRGTDGGLYCIEEVGPRARDIVHWDGNTVRRYPMPPECNYGTLRQDGPGRLWLTRGSNDPAWMLRPADANPRWKQYERLLDLIAEYAVDGGAKRLDTLRNETSPSPPPAWDGKGRAFVMLGPGEYGLYADGAWTNLPKHAHSRTATSLRFGEQGEPMVTISSPDNTVDELWSWHADSSWQAKGTVPSRYAERRETAKAPRPEPPDWVRAGLPKDPDGSDYMTIVPDATDGWWVVFNKKLWRANNGAVRPALREEIGDPWMIGAGSLLEPVEMDARGNRYFWSYDEVIIVPPAAMAPWLTVR